MMKRLKAAVAASALALASGGPALVHADDARAALSPTALEQINAGQPMRLVYDIQATAYLLFIPVTGKAEFRAELGPDVYNLRTRVKTTGIADLFVDYDMQVAASGYVTDEGLQPYSYVSQNNDGKKNRRVELIYQGDDVAMTATPAFGNLGEPPATPAQKIDAHDPISALVDFMLRPQTAENVCRGPLKTFDGRQLTHLSFEYKKMTRVNTRVFKGDAMECHVTVNRVAGYKKGDRGSNLSGIDGPMRMYIAPLGNGLHAPVKITVDTDEIGTITLEARKLRLEPITEAG